MRACGSRYARVMAVIDYPQIGMVHKNGDRVVGIEGPLAAVLYGAGTPPVWSLFKKSVDLPVVSRASIGEDYPIEFDGKQWWVLIDGERAGRTSWSLKDEERGHLGLGIPIAYPRAGHVHVTRLVIDQDGAVVNFGGVAYSA